MTVQTKYVGEVKLEQENIIHFPNGLPGFFNELKFALLDLPGNPIFQTLQSITTPSLAFIVTNPYHFYQDYTFKLDDTTQEILGIESERDIVVLSIVTLKSPFNTSTVNLKAPIIINSTHNQGKQYVINSDEYPTKASIVPAKSSKAKGE